MSAPTGRRPGRPLSPERRVRLAALDALPGALDVLTKAARLGDVQAAAELVHLALALAPGEPRRTDDAGA